MELKEFVSKAITDIVSGLVEAQESIKDLGATINPIGIKSAGETVGDSYYENEVQVQRIEFDVVVTSVKDSEAKGGIGVVGVVNLGASRATNDSMTNATSLKFSVPIVFPANLPKVYENPKNEVTQQRHQAALDALP